MVELRLFRVGEEQQSKMHEHVQAGAEEDAFPAKGWPFFQHNSQYGCENSQRHEGNQK